MVHFVGFPPCFITLKCAVKKVRKRRSADLQKKSPSTSLSLLLLLRLASRSKKSSSSIPLSFEWAQQIILKFEFWHGHGEKVLNPTLDGSTPFTTLLPAERRCRSMDHLSSLRFNLLMAWVWSGSLGHRVHKLTRLDLPASVCVWMILQRCQSIIKSADSNVTNCMASK